MDWASQTDDLAAYFAQSNDDNLLHVLNERLTLQRSATYIGNNTLLVLALNDNGLNNQYAASSELDDAPPLPPHILQVTSNAFQEMLRQKQDQTLFLLGQSGSGKSLNRLAITKHLVENAKNGKKKSKVLSGASKMEIALESFGTYKTSSSKYTSGYGRYTEYQFSGSGRMVGVKLLDYGFKKARVTNAGALEDGERTYNVFYQLLAGASNDEKQELHITDPTQFAYIKGTNVAAQTLGRSSTLSRKLTIGRSKSITKKTPASPDATPTTEDGTKFIALRENLKSLGIGKRIQSQIFKVLAAILHLGNLHFTDDENKPQDAAAVKNVDCLNIIADLLSVSTDSLSNSIRYRSKTMGRDTFSFFLKADGAVLQRNALAEALYSLLFTWIIEHINDRLCKQENEFESFIGVVDHPWFQTAPAGNTYANIDIFYANYMGEHLMHHVQSEHFDRPSNRFADEGLNIKLPKFQDNQSTIDLLDGTTQLPGIWSILSQSSSIDIPSESTAAKEISALMDSTLKPNPHFVRSSDCTSTTPPKSLFGVRHYTGQSSVDYDIESFLDENAMMSDFVSLFRGTTNDEKGESTFISNLFSQKNVKGRKSVSKIAQVPLRRPSVKHRKSSVSGPAGATESTSVESAQASTQELITSIKETRQWFIYCIAPNASYNGSFDNTFVNTQLQLLNIKELVDFKSLCDVDTTTGITYDDFMIKYSPLLATLGASRSGVSAMEQVKQFITSQWWPAREVALGATTLFLSVTRWKWLEVSMKRLGGGDMANNHRMSILSSEAPSDWNGIGGYRDDDQYSEADSNMESEYAFADEPKAMSPRGRNRNKDVETGDLNKPNESKHEIIEKEEKLTRKRKCWVNCTWLLTFCVPSFLLVCCGLKRPDIRMAWREKLALNIIIYSLCFAFLFLVVGLRYIICPTINVLTQDEVSKLSFDRVGTGRQPYFSVYGRYIFADKLMEQHKKDFGSGSGPGAIDNYQFPLLYGSDVSRYFYRMDSWDNICKGIPRPPENWDNMDSGLSWQNRDAQGLNQAWIKIHRGNSPEGAPQQYVENLFQYAQGRVGWSEKSVYDLSSASKVYVIVFDNVYYTTLMGTIGDNVFPPEVREIFGPSNSGTDQSRKWKRLRDTNPVMYDNYLECINNVFYIGTVDRRNTPQCAISNTLLFGASIILVAVIGIKFIAALQFGKKAFPEPADKFVILMVPCYTEGADSLSKTLDSLATFNYDDKRKLLFVICDGMIIGSGNDRPTPRIVLDILGVDSSQDPEALAFNSLGEGNKQYNMGKVYSGLYEIRGHSVPFIVVAKCGSPKERAKPGNRGKRDSQLVLMRFLNRVHFNAEFSPMELEMYHQMKNIIGVAPSYYEYILMVDADTEVEPESLNRMISIMVHDVKVMGLCGETRIANEKDSWVTMIQVYEYFISHHLAKAFESLFGTVTCLPGCFSMYRIRSAAKNVPVLVAPGLIQEYAENTVDTLHKQNLLHLGEDRYLTTLLLKHFPQMKTKFSGEARCFTVAPDRWSVLLSQRRRWINSTVHNLLELCLLDQLCGFCCFSMRFIVLLDLFATFVQPATIVYIAYLIYASTFTREEFPLISVIMLASIYGFQVIIFIAKREWQHIAWMFIYLLATPVISFYIPVYSFWHFDDFSWGNTRVVVGEGKKTVYVADTEPFDPKSIPLKRWRDFEENDLWEADSVMTGSDYQSTRKGGATPSEYSSYSKPPPSEYSVATYDNVPIRNSMISRTGIDPIPGPFPSQTNVIITDEQLYDEIKLSLVGADLMTLTKKQIRDNLSAKLGVDLRPKKDVMNRMIDEILTGQM
ncbi:hypothetical protein HDV02_002946 [Globomyces sp. JEL0801]|nr:hypothetical protein HDV02_002946 [Globomyces sp. JEL0801]